jgi:leucine dehydrogenase
MWVNRRAEADTAWATAYGVLVCMRAAVRRRFRRTDLTGLTVAVQGLGRVGHALCRLLGAAGARLIVTDLDARLADEVARELGATAVAPDAIFDQSADVFSPCALADALDEQTVPRLRCAVIAGSANNQLANPGLADVLAGRRILYAPDIVINAGGAMGAISSGGDEAALRTRLDSLAILLDGVFERAERLRISTHAAAEEIARERFRAMGGRP